MTSIYLLEIGEHATCYTGVNPAHAVVTRKGNTKIAAIITILTDMSEMYGVNQTNPSQFQLFNSTKYNGEDLLFKDSTTTLVAIATEKQTYQGYLGNDYVKEAQRHRGTDWMWLSNYHSASNHQHIYPASKYQHIYQPRALYNAHTADSTAGNGVRECRAQRHSVMPSRLAVARMHLW